MSPWTATRHSAHSRYVLTVTILTIGLLTATVTAGPATSAPALVAPRAAGCPATADGSTVNAVLKSITVGSDPKSVAVNDVDDTVYVGNTYGGSLSLVNGRTGEVDNTVGLDRIPRGIAVNQGDDTVYVAMADDTVATTDDSTVQVLGGGGARLGIITVGHGPVAVAVDQDDDTVYVTNWDDSTVSVINGATHEVDDTVAVGRQPSGVAVNSTDDTVYVANQGSSAPGFINLINGRSLADETLALPMWFPNALAVNEADDTVYVSQFDFAEFVIMNGRDPSSLSSIFLTLDRDGGGGVAVDQTDDTVYVGTHTAIYDAGWLVMVNGRTGQLLDDSLLINQGPIGETKLHGLAVDQVGSNQGLVYVTNDDSLVVVGRASATLSSSSGVPGSSGTLTIDAPQIAYEADADTVVLVCFGSAAATGLTAGSGDTWTMQVPNGTVGATVPVTVTLKGSLIVSAGSFTYVSPPPPTPVTYPPGPPTDVTATAGDARATVTWRAPANPGTYPITDYEVTSSPGGRTCLAKAPTTVCEVVGLTNGTAYTFTARALNGAGWGAASAPSSEVTPRLPLNPRIIISGSRDPDSPRRVQVSGTATDLVDVSVTPWFRFPGEASYSEGMARPVIGSDGTFSWSRQAGRKIYVYFTHDNVRSNSVAIPR